MSIRLSTVHSFKYCPLIQAQQSGIVAANTMDYKAENIYLAHGKGRGWLTVFINVAEKNLLFHFYLTEPKTGPGPPCQVLPHSFFSRGVCSQALESNPKAASVSLPQHP